MLRRPDCMLWIQCVKKDSVPDVIKVKLIYVPIKGGIVYPDVNKFLYGPG